MRKGKKPELVEHGEIAGVRPTHKSTGESTQGMRLGERELITINYRLDVFGADLLADRAGAIEMYAQMAAKKIRELLGPIEVHR